MEVVVTSECSGQLWNACVWDPQTGTTLRTFKGGISASKSLHMIAGDYLISAQKDKPIVHVWALNRQDQSTAKMIVPGIIQVLAVSPCSTYCIGGSNEQLLVWQMSTGELVASLRRHYQDVTGICFTADGSRFVSAGAEGLVLVWSLETALLSNSTSDCEPELTWSDHSLPVTGLCLTRSMVQPLVLSSSLDQTCRVRDLNTGNTLLSLQFNRPLHSVTIDWAEERVYVGSADGRIYQVDLLDQGKQQQQNKDQSDDDDEEMEQVGNDDGQKRRRKFVGHEKAVTCLSVSIDGSRLLSGSEDGSCRLWDVASGQCVRVLQHRGAVTNAFFSARCHHLQLLEQDVKLFRPSVVLTTPFEKKKSMSGAKTSAQCLVPECPLIPAAGSLSCGGVSAYGSSLSAMSRSVGGSASRGGSANEAGRQAALSDQVRHLKRLNHQLYTFAVDKLLPPNKGNNKSNSNGGVTTNDVATVATTPSAGKKRRQEQHHQRSKSSGGT